MDTKICPSCYAKSELLAESTYCEHCGYEPTADSAPDNERLALQAFHHKIAQSNETEKIKLLNNATLPDDVRNLIEAGLQCMPLIEADQEHSVRGAAAARLRAIVTKLNIRHPEKNEETTKAMAKFEQFLTTYDNKKKRENRVLSVIGAILFGFLIVGMILLCNVVANMYGIGAPTPTG